VAIDTSRKWWVGSTPNDLEEYLHAYSQDSYPTGHFRLAICACGALEFYLEVDDNEGVARRTCSECGAAHFVCDSGEYWEDAEPKRFRCIECKGDICNVGVGFAGYEDDPTGIKWLYVGERCARCGTLGCMADWKVGMTNALDLLGKV